MHIQPIDNTQDLEPFVVAMVPQEQHSRDTATETGETFDDVWGSEPSSPSAAPAREPAPSRGAHPSDVPRLRAEHTTAGYREGVTAAKATSIQDGFDEGFSLGAALGAKAGQLIGVLEGITRALDGHSDADSKAARGKMLDEATQQLRVEGLFTPEYWNMDGTWKYDVKAPRNSDQSERQVVFADVADAHPIIARWTKIVDDEIERWAIDRRIFADVGDEGRQIVQEKPPAPSVPQTKKPLDW